MNHRLDATFYNLTQSFGGAYVQAIGIVRAHMGESPQPPPPILQVQAGRAESPGWFMVQAAEFDPDPLTVDNLRVRDVYGAPRMVAALLDLLTAHKWLDRRGDAYYLTADGRTYLQRRRQDGLRWLAAVDTAVPLPAADYERLENLCHRVITACMASETPPGTWCLAHSRNRAPADDAPLSARMFQYVADFNAFRDDAHMAAWQPYGIEGVAWESFSFLCTGQAETAAALFDQLSYRGYSIEAYTAVLAELARRNWLATGDGTHYSVTENGRATHDRVEKLTDQYFYTPWQTALSDDEIVEMHALMEQLRDNLPTIKFN